MSSTRDLGSHILADGHWLERLLSHKPAITTSLRDMLRAVIAHTPRLVASRMLISPEAGTLGLSLEGTVMFADLDGFTPLAERFSQLPSNEGAEELTGLINQFMAILIGTSRSYGGDLLKFGGDAGLLYFEGSEHALRAVTAAMAVQRMMREQLSHVETSLGQFALLAAIGLGSGRLIGLGVGDGEGREFLTLGPPLLAMGHAQTIAPPGEIVIHRSTAAACGDGVERVAVESDYYRVVAVPGTATKIGRAHV